MKKGSKSLQTLCMMASLLLKKQILRYHNLRYFLTALRRSCKFNLCFKVSLFKGGRKEGGREGGSRIVVNCAFATIYGVTSERYRLLLSLLSMSRNSKNDLFLVLSICLF